MRFCFVSFALLTLAGCSSDHPVDTSVAINEAIAEELCSCPAVAAEDFCTMPEPVDTVEIACLKRTYNEFEAELAPTVDCFIDAERELFDCIQSASCSDVVFESCFTVLEARYDACPGTTVAAANALDACDVEL